MTLVDQVAQYYSAKLAKHGATLPEWTGAPSNRSWFDSSSSSN